MAKQNCQALMSKLEEGAIGEREREIVTGLTLRLRSMHPSRLTTRCPRYGNGPRRGKKSRRIHENGIEVVDGTRRNDRALAGFSVAQVRRNFS